MRHADWERSCGPPAVRASCRLSSGDIITQGIRPATIRATSRSQLHAQPPFGSCPGNGLPFCTAAVLAVLLRAGSWIPRAHADHQFQKHLLASVSDAVELVTGKTGRCATTWSLMTGANLVGRAVTALAIRRRRRFSKAFRRDDDERPSRRSGVIVMEGTLDIAAMGNLMARPATVRARDGARRRIRAVWDVRRWTAPTLCLLGQRPATMREWPRKR